MSKESTEWLNKNTLIGFTEKRGNAWHYRASDQGDESNHYPGAIPVEDVERRLFYWTAQERSIFLHPFLEHMGRAEGYKAITTSDTDEVLGIVKDGYSVHQYQDWLAKNVATILDADLAISSAGQLRNRSVAWVEVSVPETIKTAAGVDFRPNLLACTSHDGSLATTYKRTIQLVVCDNTMSVALRESGGQFKVRHTANSALRLGEARAALDVVYETADEFSKEIERLTNTTVTDEQWKRVLDKLVPVPTNEDAKRGITTANNKREQLEELYIHDPRVSPWKGSAFGVLQAFNTWNHHVMPVRGSTERAERNMMNAVTGQTAVQDNKVLTAIGAL